MTAVRTILYDATDSMHLLAVLRSAGYAVDECRSVGELVRRLRSEHQTDLVCAADAWDRPAEGALAAARAFARAPIVLFRASNHHYLQPVWDLEVQPLTDPSNWLVDVAELLEVSRVHRDHSRKLQGEVTQLREGATRVHSQSSGPGSQLRTGSSSNLFASE